MFDLEYLLKTQGFIPSRNSCLKNKEKIQHIWFHPFIPLQVRITEEGKLTVGILRETPITPDGKLKSHLRGKVDNELLKISQPVLSKEEHAPAPFQAGSLIPARHKGDKYQKLWAMEIEQALKNNLMRETHRYLNVREMNFEHIDEGLRPKVKPKEPKDKTKGNKKKK